MAKFYRNAIVTIAAASATASSEGCFTKRDFNSTAANSPLDSRGWVLQEQPLSPRTLKHTRVRIEWECISKNTVEFAYHIPTASTALNKIQRFKKALWGFRSTSLTFQQQVRASWHYVVASYSRRSLTD
jgi:hypothetical protein